MRKRNVFWLGLISACAALQAALAAQFEIDAVHSDVSFKVRHMVVSKVSGRFDKFSGTFSYDEKNPQSWSAQAAIDASSINTANTKRDDHLRGADFFDAQKYPEITFRSTGVKGPVGNKYKLHGNLTLLGVEKPVALELETGGTIQDPRGNLRAGFEAVTTINRKDFGMTWNKALDNGGLTIGEEVEISIRVEGVQKTAESPKMEGKPKPAESKESGTKKK